MVQALSSTFSRLWLGTAMGWWQGGHCHIQNQSQTREPQNMGSPWHVATVPTRHLKDVIGSGVCYLGTLVPWTKKFLLRIQFIFKANASTLAQWKILSQTPLRFLIWFRYDLQEMSQQNDDQSIVALTFTDVDFSSCSTRFFTQVTFLVLWKY
jgi:hypothetical protein